MKNVSTSKKDCYSGKLGRDWFDQILSTPKSKTIRRRSTSEPARKSWPAPRKKQNDNYIQTKYYHPNTAQLIQQRVMSCEQCIRESRVDDRLTRPALQNLSEHITAPEDAMQIYLVRELPPCGGYEDILTAMNVFSRYIFAYPTSNQMLKRSQKSY